MPQSQILFKHLVKCLEMPRSLPLTSQFLPPERDDIKWCLFHERVFQIFEELWSVVPIFFLF